MGGNGFLPRASEKLRPMYSSGMYLMMLAMSSTTWPSPSVIFCCPAVLMILPRIAGLLWVLAEALFTLKRGVFSSHPSGFHKARSLSALRREAPLVSILNRTLRAFSSCFLRQRIFFAQRVPIGGDLLAVVFDLLRNDAPGGAARSCRAVAGFIGREFENILAPGEIADVRPDPVGRFEIEADLFRGFPILRLTGVAQIHHRRGSHPDVERPAAGGAELVIGKHLRLVDEDAHLPFGDAAQLDELQRCAVRVFHADDVRLLRDLLEGAHWNGYAVVGRIVIDHYAHLGQRVGHVVIELHGIIYGGGM